MRNTEVIYGVHPVFEALRAGRRKFHRIFLTPGGVSSRRLDKLRKLAATHNIPVGNTSASMLERLAQSEHHQGVVARVSPFPVTALAEVLASDAAGADRRFLIILDNLTDPRNLGAIVRSALAVEAEAILLPKDRSAGPTPAVSKTSAGALEHTRLVRVTNVVATMRQLREHGCWLYGLEPTADQSVYEVDFTGSVALVVGGEERGIRPLVKKNCDVLLSIPQSDRLESLNASVAAAIAMYEVYRQRLANSTNGHA